ncbi:fimbrial assembly protein [Sporosarcina sp. Sa2YVA2]|uniref:Fimbrial assembly protein n=1 Tax=Sporosarcina quadrami TaxID=2762234 RepID=A0ABR8U5I6_9BACL|nr:fimbrial assembly protein [Sporosarcina quadrami]MBD7983029.1 fimbrial assembly protein [Sporosarcina quadrami]
MLVDINLLPEKERERSTLLIAALAILSVAILFWAVLFLYSNHLTKKTVHLETQVASLHVSQEALREELQPTTTSSELQQLEATVEWAQSYRYETLPLLQELIALLPNRGFFVSFEFAAPHSAQVTVQFDEKKDAAHYLTRMKSSPFVTAATIESIVAEQLDDEQGEQVLPRFEAVYQVEFLDERNAVVEIEDNVDVEVEVDVQQEEDDADE